MLKPWAIHPSIQHSKQKLRLPVYHMCHSSVQFFTGTLWSKWWEKLVVLRHILYLLSSLKSIDLQTTENYIVYNSHDEYKQACTFYVLWELSCFNRDKITSTPNILSVCQHLVNFFWFSFVTKITIKCFCFFFLRKINYALVLKFIVLPRSGKAESNITPGFWSGNKPARA